jgi:hypothetical protein
VTKKIVDRVDLVNVLHPKSKIIKVINVFRMHVGKQAPTASLTYDVSSIHEHID